MNLLPILVTVFGISYSVIMCGAKTTSIVGAIIATGILFFPYMTPEFMMWSGLFMLSMIVWIKLCGSKGVTKPRSVKSENVKNGHNEIKSRKFVEFKKSPRRKTNSAPPSIG